MISALVFTSNGPGAPPLAEDLVAAGIDVVAASRCTTMLHAAIQTAPDLIIAYETSPDFAFFESISAIRASAPRPVVVFTPDPDAEKIVAATRSGVHAYVVNGYSANRLRSVIHLAQARYRNDQVLRDELIEVTQKFAERKLVDRAKGILMGSRQMREAEAYRALRTAAMHTKQRIGQVAQQVIDSATYGEAINRAGQMRMLSQRLVNLYAQHCAAIRPNETHGLFADALSQVDANLVILQRSLSAATFGDLLVALLAPWQVLRSALAAPAQVARLPEIDRLAEDMLRKAEQLTLNLEVAGLAGALHVINVAGRQRMLSQRLTKAALMAMLLDSSVSRPTRAAAARAQSELVAGFDYLARLPLSNAQIAMELAAALENWSAFEAVRADLSATSRREELAGLSEALLGNFDRLTDHLERGMHALIY